jgi:hypothetical protein
MVKTSLQINLAPGDWRLAQHTLPHQLETWKDQVDEVLLVVDLHRSAGRFAEGWESGKDHLMTMIQGLNVGRVSVVDSSEDVRTKVANEWTGGCPVPVKDFRGGPSYAYFYGLSQAKGRFVLHSDADIFFGGRSQTWLAEALVLLEKYPDLLFVAPLSGPTAKDGRVSTLRCTPDSRAPGGQVFDFISTRLFLLDKEKFQQRIGAFQPKPPNFRSIIKARVEGNPPWDLPEHWMTDAMRLAGMHRFEFSGTSPGMWSLHPPYRCEAFFRILPKLIAAVESGQVPEAQRGCHDFNESMVDWSEAIEKLKTNRWWRRAFQGWNNKFFGN